MILVIGGVKGGSGKSTIATNLAVMRSKDSKDVLLVDADEQASSTDFTRQRNEVTNGNAGYTLIQLSGKDVAIQGRRMAEKYDDIIIDAGGRDTSSQRAALLVSNIVLIPFCPTSADIWTTDKVIETLEEAKAINQELEVITLINKAFAHEKDNKQAEKILREEYKGHTVLPFSIGHRKAFSNAFGEGLSVIEQKPADQKAATEIAALYSHLFDAKTTQK